MEQVQIILNRRGGIFGASGFCLHDLILCAQGCPDDPGSPNRQTVSGTDLPGGESWACQPTVRRQRAKYSKPATGGTRWNVEPTEIRLLRWLEYPPDHRSNPLDRARNSLWSWAKSCRLIKFPQPTPQANSTYKRIGDRCAGPTRWYSGAQACPGVRQSSQPVRWSLTAERPHAIAPPSAPEFLHA